MAIRIIVVYVVPKDRGSGLCFTPAGVLAPLDLFTNTGMLFSLLRSRRPAQAHIHSGAGELYTYILSML